MNDRIFQISDQFESPIRRHSSIAVTVLVVAYAAFVNSAYLKAQDPIPDSHLVPATGVPAGNSVSSVSNMYVINPNDVLDVGVYDVPELSRSYTVSPSGVITVPLLSEPVQAAGLTPDQVARAMEEAFRQSGRLKRPEISVAVKASLNSSVAVEGAVRTPQILQELTRIKLVDVITQCGGLTEDAGTTATITRSPLALKNLAAEGLTATPTLVVQLKKVMDLTDPSSTTLLWPGDRVSVERQQPDVYYVLGEVKAPGGYTLKKGREELTVLRAVALAGDLTGVAKKSQAMLIRKDPKSPQRREDIKLDLQKILTGKSPDLVLQADDILFVPGSGGKKALKALQGVPAQALGSAGAAAIIIH